MNILAKCVQNLLQENKRLLFLNVVVFFTEKITKNAQEVILEVALFTASKTVEDKIYCAF